MIIIEKWEEILDFNLYEEVKMHNFNRKINEFKRKVDEIEYDLIDNVSDRLLVDDVNYQDIFNSVCTNLSERNTKDEDEIDKLYEEYCEIGYDLDMIPIEVAIFKCFNNAAIKNDLSLEDIKNNREHLVKGIADIYKKYQETNDMKIVSDIENLMCPILSR